MINIEKTVTPSPEQWEIIIEGMRNPMNSWDRSDSIFCTAQSCGECEVAKRCVEIGFEMAEEPFIIGDNGLDLMKRLNKGGTEHSKYRRMLPVYITITAPLYWWKEADTYGIGVVKNSCSTMHKIHDKEFELEDFSHEHINTITSENVLSHTILELNSARTFFLETKDKYWWWHMIQLLPTSYNQKRTMMLNYEVLAKMYRERKDHKLDEWIDFCDWIKTLPYAKELITGEEHDK